MNRKISLDANRQSYSNQDMHFPVRFENNYLEHSVGLGKSKGSFCAIQTLQSLRSEQARISSGMVAAILVENGPTYGTFSLML